MQPLVPGAGADDVGRVDELEEEVDLLGAIHAAGEAGVGALPVVEHDRHEGRFVEAVEGAAGIGVVGAGGRGLLARTVPLLHDHLVVVPGDHDGARHGARLDGRLGRRPDLGLHDLSHPLRDLAPGLVLLRVLADRDLAARERGEGSEHRRLPVAAAHDDRDDAHAALTDAHRLLEDVVVLGHEALRDEEEDHLGPTHHGHLQVRRDLAGPHLARVPIAGLPDDLEEVRAAVLARVLVGVHDDEIRGGRQLDLGLLLEVGDGRDGDRPREPALGEPDGVAVLLGRLVEVDRQRELLLAADGVRLLGLEVGADLLLAVGLVLHAHVLLDDLGHGAGRAHGVVDVVGVAGVEAGVVGGQVRGEEAVDLHLDVVVERERPVVHRVEPALVELLAGVDVEAIGGGLGLERAGDRDQGDAAELRADVLGRALAAVLAPADLVAEEVPEGRLVGHLPHLRHVAVGEEVDAVVDGAREDLAGDELASELDAAHAGDAALPRLLALGELLLDPQGLADHAAARDHEAVQVDGELREDVLVGHVGRRELLDLSIAQAAVLQAADEVGGHGDRGTLGRRVLTHAFSPGGRCWQGYKLVSPIAIR